MSAVKDKARELVEELPEDASWGDLVERVELRRKIEEGLVDLEAGRKTPHEKVRERFLGR